MATERLVIVIDVPMEEDTFWYDRFEADYNRDPEDLAQQFLISAYSLKPARFVSAEFVDPDWENES